MNSVTVEWFSAAILLGGPVWWEKNCMNGCFLHCLVKLVLRLWASCAILIIPDEYSLILLFVLGGRQDPEYFKDEPTRGQDLELLSLSWFWNSLAQWVLKCSSWASIIGITWRCQTCRFSGLSPDLPSQELWDGAQWSVYHTVSRWDWRRFKFANLNPVGNKH